MLDMKIKKRIEDFDDMDASAYRSAKKPRQYRKFSISSPYCFTIVIEWLYRLIIVLATNH